MPTTVHLDQFKHNEMYLGAKSANLLENKGMADFFFQGRGSCFVFRWVTSLETTCKWIKTGITLSVN